MPSQRLRELLAELDSDDPDTETVADALVELEGEEPGTVVLALLALPDLKPPARWVIAHVLGDLGTPAVAGIPFLVRLLRDPAEDNYTRSTAAWALTSMGDAGIDTFVSLCRDPDPYVRRRAALELGNLGRYTTTVVVALLGLLSDTGRAVQNTASESLARCTDGSVVPGLTRALQDEEPLIRVAAARALLHIDARNAVALATAVGRLRDESPAVRAAACDALAVAERAAAPALGELVRALAEENPDVRERAAHAIQTMREAAVDAAVPLGKALHDSRRGVRDWAGLGLMWLGEAARPATADLVEALRVRVTKSFDPEDEVYNYIVYLMRSVGNIGPPAAAAIPSLELACEIVATLPDHLELAKWAIARCQGRE